MMFRSLSFILLLACFLGLETWAQKKPLPRNINIPTNNHKDPKLPATGTILMYLSDYSPTREYEPMMTTRNGIDKWIKPEGTVKGVFKNNLDLVNAYSFSVDGSQMYITSRRAPGIGNYDIWMTEKRGNAWSAPINLGKPVNSIGNEGAPSISADGKTLYFMRCDKIDNQSADGCKIMVSERRGTRWKEPDELPETINAYNSGYPEIHADGTTLLFSSTRPGGSGGWDFYISKNQDGYWGEPMNVEIANTPADNRIASIPAKGDLMFFSGEFKDKQALIIAKLPDELRPEKLIMLEGTVTDKNGHPVEAIVSGYDADSKEEILLQKNDADGSFLVFLPEGHYYDFSVYPLKNDKWFHSTFYEFETPENSTKEELNVTLEPLTTGSKLKLDNLSFYVHDTIIDPRSEIELLRLERIYKNNSSMSVEFGVHAERIFIDSLPSSPELTEILRDTIYYDFLVPEDSLERLSLFDSLFIQGEYELTLDSAQYYTVEVSYHNDRTHRQANSLLEYLEKKGFPMEQIEAQGYGGELGPPADTVDYWVEMKILSK